MARIANEEERIKQDRAGEENEYKRILAQMTEVGVELKRVFSETQRNHAEELRRDREVKSIKADQARVKHELARVDYATQKNAELMEADQQALRRSVAIVQSETLLAKTTFTTVRTLSFTNHKFITRPHSTCLVCRLWRSWIALPPNKILRSSRGPPQLLLRCQKIAL